jgi:hypothetical protein
MGQRICKTIANGTASNLTVGANDTLVFSFSKTGIPGHGGVYGCGDFEVTP